MPTRQNYLSTSVIVQKYILTVNAYSAKYILSYPVRREMNFKQESLPA